MHTLLFRQGDSCRDAIRTHIIVYVRYITPFLTSVRSVSFLPISYMAMTAVNPKDVIDLATATILIQEGMHGPDTTDFPAVVE